MDNFFIFCAEYLFIPLFLIAVFFFFKQPRKVQIEIVIWGIAVAIISYAVALLAGQLYNDPRPFVVGHFKPLIAHDAENGFPSDHVLLTSFVACVVCLFNKWWGFVLWLLVFLIATARVYVGVHHAVDVLGSMLITVVVTLIVRLLLDLGRVQGWVAVVQRRFPVLL